MYAPHRRLTTLTHREEAINTDYPNNQRDISIPVSEPHKLINSEHGRYVSHNNL